MVWMKARRESYPHGQPRERVECQGCQDSSDSPSQTGRFDHSNRHQQDTPAHQDLFAPGQNPLSRAVRPGTGPGRHPGAPRVQETDRGRGRGGTRRGWLFVHVRRRRHVERSPDLPGPWGEQEHGAQRGSLSPALRATGDTQIATGVRWKVFEPAPSPSFDAQPANTSFRFALGA